MDKKNTIIGLTLLLAAVGSYFLGLKYAPAPAPVPAAPVASSSAANTTGPAIAPTTAIATASAKHSDAEQIVTLANEFVQISFSDFGGAIREVAFQKYPAVQGSPEPYVFNQLRYASALSFVGLPGFDQDARWELVEHTQTRVVYRATQSNKIEITRIYTLPANAAEGEPYRVRAEIVVRNLSSDAIGAQRITLNLGTAAPVNLGDTGVYLNIGAYDGEETEFTARHHLEGGGFLSWFGLADGTPKTQIDLTQKIVWASVKNQFFAGILTSDVPGTGLVVRRVKLDLSKPDTDHRAFGVTGEAHYELPRIEPNSETRLGFNFYTGPKEYKRLSNLGSREDLAMEFGFFGFFSKILLSLMTWCHNYISANWGIAIILTTLLLKTVFLPLTLSAAKSAKRMTKIQPQMQEIREKYKDNPQKLQKETMELFKEHRVNPVGGCLPILITIPFFIGFFSMLQTTAELRFASFLWAPDLSAPDTVARVFGLPLNIMPLLMGITMIVQMRLTPTPSVDNVQVKMMQIMPYIFTLICYNFSCALALYSTVGNVFSIGQQLIINRMKDVVPPPTTPVVSTGKKPKKK